MALPKPADQSGTVKVYDRVHDATKNLPEYWDRNDGWYNYTTNVRGVSHVLDTVVADPFGPQPQGAVLDGIAGSTMGFDHPVSWCKDYKGGRSFYTSLGQTAAGFDADMTKHLLGAINWSAGVSDVHYSDCGATVLANYQQVSLIQPNLSEPIGFDQLPDGRIIQTDRRGGVHLHNFADGSSRVIAKIPVYNQSEDGLYGGAVDNNFATNHWVYLYYAPPNVDNITYSDGTTGHTNNFDVASGRSNSAAPTQAVNISRLRLLDRVLPAVAVQVRRRARAPDASISPASSRSCASRSTAAPAATWPATSTSTSTTTSGSRPATTAPQARATPATGARASTSGPTRTRPSA